MPIYKYIRRFSIIAFLPAVSLLFSCNFKIPFVPRSSQSDTTPPSFVNLVFPADHSFLSEGQLLITGQLIDPESGFDPETPLFLVIDVLGAQGQEWSHTFNAVDCASPDPSYFDVNTGMFRIQFGDYRRLKQGMMRLTLKGMDGARNISTGGIAQVTVGDIVSPPGSTTLNDIYAARTLYGQDLVRWLSSYRQCLAVYGNQYAYDISVITYLAQFISSTYVMSPHMDTWTVPMNTLEGQINALQYQDPVVKEAVDTSVLFFKHYLEDEQKLVSDPFYLDGASKQDIIDKRALIVSWFEHNFTIVTSTVSGTTTCHVSLNCLFNFGCDPCDLYNIADYTVVSNPGLPISITGMIGSQAVPDNVVYITPDDYDPPIALFALFNETTSWLDLVIY